MAAPFDCVILGGGPAGLAAAVYMGRYLRSTLVLDHKKPQTRWHRPIAHNVLGFPSGIHRNQLLDWGRSHIAKYPSVQTQRTTVRQIRQARDLFVLTDDAGVEYEGRGLILSPGVEYLLPDLPDILAYAGHSLWHCPECDGYKCQDERIAVIAGRGAHRGSAEMALGLHTWTRRVTLLTNGAAPELDPEASGKLAAAGIAVQTERIVAIRGDREEGQVEGLELADGTLVECRGVFANEGVETPEELLGQLPLEMVKGRWIKVDHRMRTNIARCYAAGDIVAEAQTQLSVAMGTGATAAIWLNKELIPPELCLSGREW